jgi:hypothetical protein
MGKIKKMVNRTVVYWGRAGFYDPVYPDYNGSLF